MRLWSVLGVLAAAGPGVADATDLKHITFDRGEVAVWSASVSPRDHTPARVADEVAPLALPTASPALPARGSTFSTLFRARDLFDLERHPATTAAKLFQLKEDGERQGTACTAQFVGPRHLLTAAHCLVDRATGRPRPASRLLSVMTVGVIRACTVSWRRGGQRANLNLDPWWFRPRLLWTWPLNVMMWR